MGERTNIDLIEDEIKGITHKTQMQIARVVCGDKPCDLAAFWQSVAYYNFVQIGLPTCADRSPIPAAIPRSKAAFSELIGLSGAPVFLKQRPTHIIAVGPTVTWKGMPPTNYTWAYALQGYNYPDGNIGLATVIYHPAKRGLYPFKKMAERIRFFLQLKPDDRSVRELLSSESASLFQ